MSDRRCDGCGHRTSSVTIYKDDDEIVVKYCPGCEMLRRRRGVEPGDHEQYKLAEAGVATDGGTVQDEAYEYEEPGQRRVDDRHAKRARELARDGIYIEARREASKIRHYPRCNDVLDDVHRQQRREGRHV